MVHKINKVRIMVIRFSNTITLKEIPLMRGALIHALDSNSNLLFHNHDESGLRYAYPLIQYKRINNKAAMVCINEGADVAVYTS